MNYTQQTLFHNDEYIPRTKTLLSNSIDKLNARFGRDTVTIGVLPIKSKNFSGTKIAFGRIPSKEEFNE